MSGSSIGNKQQLLMQSLTQFFTKDANIQHFIASTKSDSIISLRVIDWFVTNYSREFDVSYKHPATGIPFMVHDAYKSQLKAYSKRQFDPFCRRTRINFYYKQGRRVVTTVGQLNFFRWAIDNDVLHYIQDHRKHIETHMKKHVKKSREAKKTYKNNECVVVNASKHGAGAGSSGGASGGGSKTKRKPSMSVLARRTISKHNVQMI